MELSGHEWQRAEGVLGGEGAKGAQRRGQGKGVARTLLCVDSQLRWAALPLGGGPGLGRGNGERDSSL